MIRRPPRSTRTDTLFPYTTLFRSERGVTRRRPAGMIMTLDGGATPAIDARKILFERRRFAISPAHPAVESAETALSAGAIVGGYDHQRVVERSEERRVGKECVSTCRSRWWPYHSTKKRKTKHPC